MQTNQAILTWSHAGNSNTCCRLRVISLNSLGSLNWFSCFHHSKVENKHLHTCQYQRYRADNSVCPVENVPSKNISGNKFRENLNTEAKQIKTRRSKCLIVKFWCVGLPIIAVIGIRMIRRAHGHNMGKRFWFCHFRRFGKFTWKTHGRPLRIDDLHVEHFIPYNID